MKLSRAPATRRILFNRVIDQLHIVNGQIPDELDVHELCQELMKDRRGNVDGSLFVEPRQAEVVNPVTGAKDKTQCRDRTLEWSGIANDRIACGSDPSDASHLLYALLKLQQVNKLQRCLKKKGDHRRYLPTISPFAEGSDVLATTGLSINETQPIRYR